MFFIPYLQFKSDSSTPQEVVVSETIETTHRTQSSEKPNNLQISADLKPFPFMRLPFDIRRLAYEELYPTKRTIDLSQMNMEESSVSSRSAYKVSKASTAFLRTCRQVNDEIYDVLYGMNNIVYWPKLEHLMWGAANNRVSIKSLPPSVCQKVLGFHIVLDGKIDVLEKMLFLKALPYFPQVLITIVVDLPNEMLFPSTKDDLRYMLLQRLRTDCIEIACARAKSGLTLWDDLEESDARRMLERALPEGYQRGVCQGMRHWWKETDGWRKNLWFNPGL